MILRTPIPDDAEFYAALENNPRVKHFVGGPSGHTADYYCNNIMQGQKKNNLILTVTLRDSGTIIGRAGILGPNNHEIEIHTVLAEEYWGKKFGLEIVTTLMEHCKKLFPGEQIVSKVHPSNTVSIRIIERLGFREAGPIQSHGYDNAFRKFLFK